MKKTNVGNVDLNELKGKISEIKAAAEKAKEENKEENKEVPKQTLGQKIIGIGAIILLLGGMAWALLSNLDTLLLPKNSIKIVVADENGEIVDGVSINIRSLDGIYDEDFSTESEIIILGATPGEYIVTFDVVPQGYECGILTDNFVLEQDGKVKVEYECRKND